MLTLNNIIILRNVDLKRFFDVEEFWIQRNAFFDIVKERTADIFFDTEKEKECYALFYMWSTQKGTIQAEVKNNILYARIGSMDKIYPLGRLASAFQATSETLSMKDRIGISFMYLMIGADNVDSDIDIRYDLFASTTGSKNGIPSSPFVIKHEDWHIPHKDISFPLHRKVIANKSNHSITIISGEQHTTLQPQECVIGLFTSDGCYKLLPHHIVSPDGGLQLRLICGNNCANLEIHQTNKVRTITNVCSIAIEAGNSIVYLKEDGELVYDNACFELKSKYSIFVKHYNKSDLIAIERKQGQITLYTMNDNPF